MPSKIDMYFKSCLQLSGCFDNLRRNYIVKDNFIQILHQQLYIKLEVAYLNHCIQCNVCFKRGRDATLAWPQRNLIPPRINILSHASGCFNDLRRNLKSSKRSNIHISVYNHDLLISILTQHTL